MAMPDELNQRLVAAVEEAVIAHHYRDLPSMVIARALCQLFHGDTACYCRGKVSNGCIATKVWTAEAVAIVDALREQGFL
jgi:hypothetical protein